MTREEYLIKSRRAERGSRGEVKRSLIGVLAVQVLICAAAYGGIIGLKSSPQVRERVKYYLSYSVDYKASAEGIADRLRSILTVKGDA